MSFKDPWILLFIPVFILLYLFLHRRRPDAGFIFPSDEPLKGVPPSWREFLAAHLPWLRLFCVILLIVAIARPQTARDARTRRDAIGIVLAIDCSSTMLAEDLQLGSAGLARLTETADSSKRLNRLDAVKIVARDFVRDRPEDLIGLVAFAADAFIACPLTFDHEWLDQSIGRLKIGLIKDGTAIGSGILSGLTALKDTAVKSKVIVLLSDGVNNAGEVPPLVAAKAARAIGVKIYTVGIISRGQTPFPTVDESGRKVYKDVKIDVNETVMQKIAELTNGQYFRASDIASLRRSYQEIDKLERVSLEEKNFSEREVMFYPFLAAALGLLLLEVVLGNTLLRKVP